MGRKQRAKESKPIHREVRLARMRWKGRWSPELEASLAAILGAGLRVSRGEVDLLDGALYVNHAGLLALARRNRCAGIQTKVLAELSYPELRTWVVEATVFRSATAKRGFVGLGDADPSNVSPLVRGSELRVAETRAVNRALRKAYAIGLCSAEEIGGSQNAKLMRLNVPPLRADPQPFDPAATGSVSSVQDRLKLILRDHQLDPVQVLHYACRFLDVRDVREASAEQWTRFVNHLEQFAISSCAWLRAELKRTDPAHTEGDNETEKAA